MQPRNNISQLWPVQVMWIWICKTHSLDRDWWRLLLNLPPPNTHNGNWNPTQSRSLCIKLQVMSSHHRPWDWDVYCSISAEMTWNLSSTVLHRGTKSLIFENIFTPELFQVAAKNDNNYLVWLLSKHLQKNGFHFYYLSPYYATCANLKLRLTTCGFLFLVVVLVAVTALGNIRSDGICSWWFVFNESDTKSGMASLPVAVHSTEWNYFNIMKCEFIFPFQNEWGTRSKAHSLSHSKLSWVTYFCIKCNYR